MPCSRTPASSYARCGWTAARRPTTSSCNSRPTCSAPGSNARARRKPPHWAPPTWRVWRPASGAAWKNCAARPASSVSSNPPATTTDAKRSTRAGRKPSAEPATGPRIDAGGTVHCQPRLRHAFGAWTCSQTNNSFIGRRTAACFPAVDNKEASMNLAPRQLSILELVRERGYVSIEELAQQFTVTPQTIRRDINQLGEAGLLRRYHGGAAHDSSVQNTAYTQRARQMRDEKRRIADAMAAHIPDQASLFINIGTTTEAIAHALLNHRGLKIITNNLHVASILSPKEDFDVLIAGGNVRSDGGVVGQATADFISQFKVDFALIGISGIDEDGTLLDFDYQEVRVSQAIIDNARKVYLAADSSKFGRNAMTRLGSFDQIDMLFTEA